MSGKPLHRAALCLLLVLLAGSAHAVEAIPARISQGELAVGRVDPAAEVRLGERRLRVDAEGRFVFAAGRDENGPLHLHIIGPEGDQTRHDIEVTPRQWRIERVTGVPQQTVTPDPAIAERIAREQARVVAARRRDDARSDFAVDFRWPTRGRISGVFGSQRVYNGTPRSPHSGLDVAAASGTPLYAPAAGIVTFAEADLFLTGGTVLIDHGHGVSSVFLHLSRIDVEPGQRLEAGEAFGAVGATGRATGPHMHWGLNWFDLRLDPALLPGIREDLSERP